MANDASNHPTNSSDADMNVSGDHTEFDAVQLAQANTPQEPQQPQKTAAIPAVPNGTVHVEIPQGEKVVRVAVANGETVVLPAPFDDQAALAAKEGNGNLAIKVGDVTVILEGYQQTVDASGNPTVTLEDPQGDKIDIAVVLASTDPNLDIETAAGPAVGAQGADNTGALLSAFDGAGGLGGLNAVGVLDATALQYKLIDNAIRLDRDDELLTTSHPLDITVTGPKDVLHQSHLRDPIVTINDYNGNPTYNDFINGNGKAPAWDNHFGDFEGTDPLAAASMHTTGEVVVDPHNESVVDVTLNPSDLAGQHLTSNGVELVYKLSQDGTTIFGFRGDGSGTNGADGALVLVVHVADTGTKDAAGATHFVVDYYLTNRLDDLAGDSNGGEDSTHLNVGFDVTTSFEQTGSTSTTVTYQDDAPIAANDTDALAVGELSQSGNVVTGDGTAGGVGGAGADKGGADGATVTGVVGFNGSTDTNNKDGLNVTGEYGKLSLNADGSYTYTRNPGSPGGVTDKFTYTLTDDDGDKSTATLTINVGNDIPEIHVPTIDGMTKVFEKGLPQGSGEFADGDAGNKSDQSEIVSGVVTYKEGDGPASITITDKDGKAVTVAAGVDIVGKDGTLHINSVGGGNINYTYTLTTNTSGDTTHDDFKMEIVDKDGDKANGTLVINIVDDVPDAKNDTDTVSNVTNTATGNVVTGADTTSGAAGLDLKGADGASVSQVAGQTTDADPAGGFTVQGKFGTLQMADDGTYTYTRFDGKPIDETDTFTYTLKDGDGDTDTATLTVTIKDNDIKITDLTPKLGGGDTKVEEDGLSAARGAGESAGSDGSGPVVGNGDFKVNSPDGLASLTIDGKAIITNGVFTATTIDTGLGNKLNITGFDPATGTVTYNYTLLDNEQHDPVAGKNSLFEDFTVVVTDKDGDQASDTLSVNIVDDVPTARNDTDTVDNATNIATGNVVTGADTTGGLGGAGADTKGADGASVSGLVSDKTGKADADASDNLTVQGQYGTLTMKADGTYTYTRDPASPSNASESFTYTLKDGDGDTSTATLTVGINDKVPEIHAPTAADQTTVNEKGLPLGSGEGADGNPNNKSDQSEVVNGTITYNEGDAPAVLTITDKDGKAVTVAAGVDIVGKDGTLHINSVGGGNVSYTYTLTTNTSGDATTDTFKLDIQDKDGDKATDNLVIKIVDDVPDAKNDTDTVDTKTGTATGNVISGADTTSGAAGADVKGADGASVSKLVGVTSDDNAADGLSVQGTYGKLVMKDDGSYTYTRDSDAPILDKNGNPIEVHDVFTYTLKDGDGDTDTATLDISIKDNPTKIIDLTPKASGGDVTVEEDGLSAGRGAGESAGSDGTGPVASSGDFKISAPDGVQTLTIGGKDVISNGVFTATTIDTGMGNKLAITGYDAATGTVTYTYTLLDNETHSAAGKDKLFEDFGVTVTDKDGDTANDTLSVAIVDDVPTAKNDTDSVLSGATSTDGNVITGTGTTSGVSGIDIKGADGASVSAVTGSKGSDTDLSNGSSVQGTYGKLSLNADGTYTYTRDGGDPILDKNGNPIEVHDVFTYTLKDGDGDTSTATLDISIKDSGCNITDLTPKTGGGDTLVDEDGLLASRGAGESAGSDGSGPTKGDGDFTINAPDGVGNLTIDGHAIITNGVFAAASWATPLGNTMSVTGYDANTGKVTYNYTLNDNEAHAKGAGENSLYEDLTVKLTDKDGDTANGTLSVNIVDDVPVGTVGDKVLGANPEKNNVLLVLDTTGSMGVKYPTDSSPTNKLQFEVQAAKNLLDAYLAAGNGDGANLRVQIVTFSVKAQAWTTEWVDIQEAKEILNQIGAMTPTGNTNYDAGIQQALAVSWTPNNSEGTPIAGATNSTYFFSDGLPNENNDGTNGLNGAQATAWLNELKGDDINAYAIGMIDAAQVDPAAAQNELNKIAYNGKTETDTNAIVVTDPSQLTSQIVATIVNKGDGSIVGDLGGKYGADGGSGVNSITLNGKTYTFDGANAVTTTGASSDTYTFSTVDHHLIITTSIGKFDIDMDDGKYTYEQKGGVETAVDVGWTIIDKDGDVSNGGTLHLLAPIPVVHLAADPVLPTIANFDATHRQIGLNDSAQLNGNADGKGDYLDGTFGNHTMKGGLGDDLYIVNGNDTVVEQYRQGHDTVQSSVTYTLTNAVEDLVLTGANNINGTGNDSDNTIVGNTGNNVLTGGSGNDILIGGAGADTMKGDAGNDQFLHVDKADLTSGGVNGGDGDDLVDLGGLATFKSADGDHSKISNVEILSFTGGNAAGTQVALDYNSVLTMTDANNNLVIHGDQGKDTVALSGGFTKIGADVTANDGLHYDVFQAGTGANLVTVFVDHNLNATAN